jgi:pyruvate kinase
LDYVALSFVRSVDVISELRELIASHKIDYLPIIAKIEKRQAIDDLEEIRDVSDGMMVARGDLGIEMFPQEVPLLQKRIIECCDDGGKPGITATQMLQSMVDHPRPTRAEASDVANAIIDRTDAVTLSQEATTGPKHLSLRLPPAQRHNDVWPSSWGVECLLLEEIFTGTDDMLDRTVSALESVGVQPGDQLVITSGLPFGGSTHSNLIQV